MARVLIADDHPIVRAGLKQLLEEQPDFEVAGEASTGAEALQLVRDQPWDLLVLDIAMPDRTGIDVLTSLKAARPELPVLILSAYPESLYALNVLRAGASGYLTKESAPQELVTAVRTVLRGNRYLSPTLASTLLDEIDSGGQPLHTLLSRREFQIFCKLSGGKSVSEIADELFLSVKTVSTYRTRILEKMNMKTNADMTYYAIKNGLIQ